MRPAAALSLLLATSGAFAQSGVDPLRACAYIEAAEARLACFDRELARPPDQLEPTPDIPPPTTLAQRWQLEAGTRQGRFQVSAYRPTYALLLAHNSRPNQAPYQGAPNGSDVDPIEIKFQLSFKTKLWEDVLGQSLDLWFAYTQRAFWQAYEWDASSPFRETNYEPELLLAWRTRYPLLGLRGRVVHLGINHQSNGQAEPLSRSWNRLVAGTLLERGPWQVWARAWLRLPEPEGEDDNPDIVDYLGRGDLTVSYRSASSNTYAAQLRGNLNTGRGSLQLDWGFPLGGPLQGYLQVFHGYGESLIDYDHVGTRVGVGVVLSTTL